MAETETDTRPESQEDERAHLDEELIARIRDLVRDGQIWEAAELAAPLHPADQADLIEQLGPEGREKVVEVLRARLDAEVLPHLDEAVREEVVEQLGAENAARLIGDLESDDAVDVLSGLEPELQAQVLAAMPRADRAQIESGLQFPEDSAGRLMQREFVAVPEYWTVGQTIDYLREAPELPEDFFELYIVDPRFRPVGAVRLSMILRSRRDVALRDLSMRDLRPVPAETDQEEVALQFTKYGLVSAPVVNDRGRLLGTITFDDVVDVIQEETEEDLMRLGGVSEDDLYEPAWDTFKGRVPWLVVNLFASILGAAVVGLFESSIAQLTTLAVLMPIVVSLGGNAGIQSLTVVVRALATREVTRANALRILGKELVVGSMNGTTFLVLGLVLALAAFGQPMLGLVFGLAMLIVLIVGAAAGVVLPVVIERLKLDPAVSSGVFLTTLTDVVGFFAFLGLATLILL